MEPTTHTTVRAAIAWLTFPLLLITAVVGTLAGMSAGYDSGWVVTAMIFLCSLPLFVLQLWMPFEDAWRGRPKDFSIDLLHMVSTGLTTDALRAVSFGVLFATAAWFSAHTGISLWPTEWPLVFQLVLGLLIGDFGAYWVHRLCHTVPVFWRIHAMHHSSERLYVLASGRNHPFNVVMAFGSQALPMILLGAQTEALALVSVFTAVHGMLQHCNVDLKHGWLNWVFATADLHRWHHSAEFEESNTNFGSNIILWDVVFGTRFLPADRSHPAQAGLTDVAIPENWFAHLASPFTLQLYKVTEAVKRTLSPAPERVAGPGLRVDANDLAD